MRGRMRQVALFGRGPAAPSGRRGPPAVLGVNRFEVVTPEPSERTYGTLRLKNGRWELSAEPHVMIIAKRMFAQSNGRQYKTLKLSNTPEVCRDLDWFMERYPLEVDGVVALRTGADAHRERQSLVDKLLSGKLEPAEVPLALPPRDYQRTAAQMLMAMRRMILGDDLGVGKTVSAICPLAMGATPALIVTMTHLVAQWRREIGRFAPDLQVHVLGKGTPYDYAKDGRHPDVLLSTYSKLDGWAETLAPIVRYVVFDECQELRSGPKREAEDGDEPGSARGSRKCAAAVHLSRHAEYVLGLSATPFYNRGGELFWVMDAIKPGALGTRDEFKQAWCTGAEPKLTIKEPAAFGCMLRDTGLMLRRTREDVGQEMPPVTVVPHTVQSDHRVFDDVASAASELARLVLDKNAHRQDRFKASGDLDQMLRQATGLAKAPYVADFVELILADDEPVVLFGWHKSVYDVWRERLARFNPAFYTGDETPKQKDEAVQRFIAGDTRLLILSLRSGAGIDGLQRVCRTCVFGELDWSPGVHEQCTGRIDRPGQQQRVVSYYLVSDSGSDPIVADVLGVKRAQIEGVRNPHRSDVIERIDNTGDHIKRLAERYLKKIGRTAA
jgi:superfamily II DNA or RNA helicase